MFLVIFELIYIIRSLKISYQSKLRIKDEIRDQLYEGFQSVALNIQDISLTIINCTFLSNSANDMNPGAITVTTSLIVTIDESIFENNTGMSEGGAIYIDAKTFKITNSSFINNLCYTTTETTESKGGAIFIKCQVDSEQTFESCLFTKNMAKTSGGSIFIDFTTYSYKSVLISNCLFNESESDQKGGAINLLYQDMANEITGETSIFCSIFEHCHAYTGGSLYLCDLSNIKTDKKTISNCTFVNSTSNSNGSAIYSEINYLNIINCNFSLCQTPEEGTVYINTTFETFESYFDSNILTNCTSKSGGSLSIHCENEIDSYRQISIENCIFKYSIAELNGGAINAIGNLATSIHNCDFNDNEVKQYGGAIYSNVQTVNINRCHFINCKAFSDKEESRGGAIYLDRSLTRTLDYMEKNVFNLCESYCGGALFIKDIDMDCIIQILECNFSRCQSVKEGGAISNGEISTDGQESQFDYNIFHLSFCLFLECESRSGGALFFQDGSKKSDEETKILSCRFMNCFASGGEGYAISCRSYKAEIDNNTFFNHNRTASDAVGVIVYLEFNDESLIKAIFDRNVFEDNFQVSGLQINITKASAHLTLNDNKFLNYKDDGLFGGTFSSDIGCINFDYWVSPSTSIILNGFEFNNIKNMQCIRGTKAQISGQISNCNFTNISYKSLTGGPCGSCIYLPFLAPNINERRDIAIHFCIFTNIESNGEGGAIYANCEVTGIQNNQFYNCRTSSENGNDQGGAIFLDAQSMISQEYIAGCLFEDCSSTNSGGAIFANCVDLEENNRRSTRANDNYQYAIMIDSCNFTRCHTKVRGGAISSGIQTEEIKSGDNDFIIRSCIFVECESGSGGALYFLDGTEDGDEQTYIGYCTFINCFASGGEGYAISCRSYNADIFRNAFKEHKRGANNATHSILYIQMNEEVTPNLSFLTFENNSGVSGLKLITASSVTVSYFTFQNYADYTPCVNLDQWIITNADTQVILDNWQFTNISESRCIYMSEHKLFKAVIQNSYFNDTVIKFSNSLYSHNSDGSCILCHKSGNIEVTSCHFTNALAHGSGGAIYAESQSIDIKKCTFTNCHTSDDSDDYKGGAIYIDSKTAADHEYLQDNIFENCSSSFSGGAIFIFCSDVNKTSPDYNPSYDKAYQIYQCNFTNCRSTTEGGAICIGETNPDGSTVGTNDISILNCFFTDCQSGCGGAIKAQDGTKSGDEQTSICFCTFTNCIAKEGEGYAISCRSYMISMYYLNFYDHKSSKNDKTHSIVYIEMNEANTTPALRDFTYECNSGVSSIILFSASSTALSNFTFRNYEDTIPCINLDEWSIPVVNNILEGFKFHNIVNARCIAMTQDKISATVIGSEFINISHRSTKLSLNKGGSSIYIANNESLILKNSIRIRDCKFINNQAESQGGSIYGESQAFDIEFCQFINCHTTSEDELRTDAGGAIFLLGIKAIGREFIQANIFEDCSAGYSGGAIFIYGRDLEEEDPGKYAIIFFDCSFTRCKSGVEGGAVSSGINYGESDNSVDAYGDNDIGFSSCNFTDCESGKGGALYFQNGDADGDEETLISVCIFTNCTAREGQGYSISCQSYKLTITVCTFKEHKRSAINNSHCILYIKMDEREVTPLLNYLTFEDNAGVSSLTLKIANSVALNNFIFNNYHLSEYSQSQCIDLDSWSIQGSVTFDNCNFTNIDNLQCITSIDVEFIANIYKCEFINISTQLLSYTGIKHYGACISSRSTKGNIIANETIFKNVTVSNGHGGAIFAFVESIDITACKFYSCHVSSKLNESQEDVSAQGGAIYLDATTGETIETIKNCLFENCSSTYSGGAIFAYCFDQNATSGFELHTIRIENCNFSYCKSEVEGGAISSGVKLGDKPVEGDDDIIISKCYFVGCESRRGGAIFSQDGTKSGDEQTTINQCQFINCFAHEGEGYAISCRSYKITMYNLEFKEHKRDAKNEKQSIVYIEMNEADKAPTISHFTYENNSGVSGLTLIITKSVDLFGFTFKNYDDNIPCIDLDQWSISNEETTNKFTFTRCTFDNIKDARCIYMSQKKSFKAILSSCTFTNISVDNFRTIYSPFPVGSCILCKESGDLELSDCTFTNCRAAYDGGAIYAESQAININDCYFISCHASSEQDDQSRGGAIYLDARNSISFEHLRNNIFENCTSTHSGGALFVYCKDVYETESIKDYGEYAIQLTECNFTFCKSGKEGGAISSGEPRTDGQEGALGDNDFLLLNCYFTECESGNGGALFFQDGTKEGNEETIIMRCYFINCFASGGEGYAISSRSYKLSITACSFTEHKRGNVGSSHCIVYIEMNEAQVSPTFLSNTFEDNNINAFNIIVNDQVLINDLNINNYNNDQYTDTPCVNLDLWSTTGIFTLINCHFTNITNMRCISSLQSRVTANISQCTFTNIKSTLPSSDGSLLQYGSCISSISNWNNILIYGNTFTNVEVVNGHGGAIYAFVQSIEIEDCIFTKCSVSSQTSSSFSNAMSQGGAIYLDASNGHEEEMIRSCTFTNCSSTYNGGAIFVFCSDQNDTTSNKNLYSARNEGSYFQYKELGDLELSDCTFTNCRAAYDGGAIYAESQAININDCHFISCHASSEQDDQSRGGAIYLDARNAITFEELRNNIFENCTSTNSGGALFVYCKDSNMIMVENSTFENNKSYRHGGAIATEKSNNIFIVKCIFENNEANYHPDFASKSPYEKYEIGNGGSIYIYTSYCTDFLQCQESNPINKSIIQIEDCLFKNNYGFNGHVIYIFGEKYGPIINITNNEFINNLNEYSAGNKTFLILSELCPIYINQITKENTFLIEHQNVDILSTNCVIEQSQTLSFLKSNEFSNSRTFSSTDIFTSTESLSFQDSNFSEKVGDFIVSKSFSLTYVIRRSVSYSFSYFLSHSFYMSYNENLGMSTVVLTQSLANGYFPYIIYFYSPIYVEQEIKIQIMKKRISPEQLIGIVCGSISVFFLILGIIINNIRRSNELKNKNNEYDYILFFDDEIKEVQNNEQNEIREIENNDQTDIIEDSSYDFLEFWA